MANELNQSYRTAYQEKDEAKMKELQEQYENLMKDYEAKEDAINKANADSYVAAYILAGKLYEYDYEKRSLKNSIPWGKMPKQQNREKQSPTESRNYLQ